jgi:drug/metabolite transporter (DMT)-like permease
LLWITLALLTAITVACRDVYVRYISSNTPPFHIMALELFWAIPLLAIALFFVEVPDIDQIFWWNFIISLPINGIAYYLYILAITGPTPISLSLPMLAFTPLFMVFSGNLILNEEISAHGGIGISLIVLGSYVLNIKHIKKGYLHPFTSLLSNSGSRYMLIVAFTFSIAAVIGKKAMLHSSALFFSFSFFLVFNLLALTIILLTKRCCLKDLFNNNLKKGAILGGLLSIHVSMHGLAISIATSAYMVAIKRTSIIFALIMGGWIFKEENLTSRAAGAVLMLIGAVYLTLPM